MAAFGAYFCVYGFRKPFTAASFESVKGAGAHLKTVLVASQVFGYTLSKFIGVKVASETKPGNRGKVILALLVLAELALVLFGFTPAPICAAFLFLNGLSLGMVFGLVIGFLEGRRQTEILAAGLCASFIVADGVTKTVGSWLLGLGVSQFWMPAAAGSLFVLPAIGFIWMLTRIPLPSTLDVAERSERPTMSSTDRRRFLVSHAMVLTPIVVVYLAATVLRSIRADFAPEIWRGLGVVAVPSIFAASETWVAIFVLLVCGGCALITDNRKAFAASLAIALLGLLLIGGSLVSLRAGALGPFAFMVLTGLGLYLPYVVIQTSMLERFLAIVRDGGNLGFLVSTADAVGYLGYAGVMVGRDAIASSGNLLTFYQIASVTCVLICTPALAVSLLKSPSERRGSLDKKEAISVGVGSAT